MTKTKPQMPNCWDCYVIKSTGEMVHCVMHEPRRRGNCSGCNVPRYHSHLSWCMYYDY